MFEILNIYIYNIIYITVSCYVIVIKTKGQDSLMTKLTALSIIPFLKNTISNYLKTKLMPAGDSVCL